MKRIAFQIVILLTTLALLAACGQPAQTATTAETQAPAAPTVAPTEPTVAPTDTVAPPPTEVAATMEVEAPEAIETTTTAPAEATTAPTEEATTAAAETPAAGGTLSGEIPIGFVFSQTGPAAIYGESQKNAAQLAVDEINSSKFLSGATLNPIFEDDASTPEQAIQVFTKLITQDQVAAIIGPTLSNSAKSSDPVAQENKTVVLGVSNTAGGITEIGDYVFRDSLPEAAVIPNTIKVAKEKLGLKKVALMYGNDDAFTKAGYDVFAKALADEGIEVLTTETFAKGDTDFSPQLTKIQGLAPDALVVSALAEEAAGIMQQARQLGIEAPIIGGNGFNSPKLAELAGPAAEGAISGAAWLVSSEAPKNQAFVQAYNAKYNTNPDQFAAQAYDGVYLLATALKNAGSADRTAIRDALDKISGYEGVLGPFSFENREPMHTPIVQVVRDGKFELYK